MIRTTRMLAGALLSGALALTACSDDSVASQMDSSHSDPGDSSSAASSSTSDGVAAPYNDADVTFVQGMIPHHEQAVEMAQMAEDRAEDPRVLALASRIEAAQQPEIDALDGVLEEWGVEDGGTSGMDHGGMDHSGGMMSEEDMEALMAAEGAQFDQLFLEQMVEHHTGAVAAAETELSDGENRTATAIARTISGTQEAEIAEMEQLLAELGG